MCSLEKTLVNCPSTELVFTFAIQSLFFARMFEKKYRGLNLRKLQLRITWPGDEILKRIYFLGLKTSKYYTVICF